MGPRGRTPRGRRGGRVPGAPRGRAGLPWRAATGTSLIFSLILHHGLSPEREGPLYAVAVSGLADALGGGSTISWPDEVRRGEVVAGAVGVRGLTDAPQGDSAVVNVLVGRSDPPRAPMLARVVDAVERRLCSDPETLLDDYRARCDTMGRQVVARLLPMGATPGVEGEVVDIGADGALVIQTTAGRRAAVLPENLGVLEGRPEHP